MTAKSRLGCRPVATRAPVLVAPMPVAVPPRDAAGPWLLILASDRTGSERPVPGTRCGAAGRPRGFGRAAPVAALAGFCILFAGASD